MLVFGGLGPCSPPCGGPGFRPPPVDCSVRGASRFVYRARFLSLVIIIISLIALFGIVFVSDY